MCRGAQPIQSFKVPVLAPAPVLAKSIPIQFSNVAEQFENSFKETFTSSDKKAHFNNLPDEFKVVDGAKGVWCNVLLVDALISLLTVKSFKKSVRRAFNQDRVLFDCITKELASVDPALYAEIMLKKERESLSENSIEIKDIKKETYQISLRSLEGPWSSLDSLRNSLAESPHSKAKAKYTGTVALLTSHEELLKFNCNFHNIIQAVIQRVLFELPVPLEINPAPATRTAPVPKTSKVSSDSEGEQTAITVPKQQKRKRASDNIKMEGTKKQKDSSIAVTPSTFRLTALNISTNEISPFVNIVSPSMSPVSSPVMCLQMPPASIEDDLCLDDFFFDEDCCDEFLSATFSPQQQQQHQSCAVVSPVSDQQVPVIEDFSSSLDTLRAYFTSDDDSWLDGMMMSRDSHCGRESDEQSISSDSYSHSQDNNGNGDDCCEEFSLSADECSLLMGLDDDNEDDMSSVSDSETDEQQYGVVSFPAGLFDRQYHSCEDLEMLDFPLLSGVLSKPPTPRMAGNHKPSITRHSDKPVHPQLMSAQSMPALLRQLSIEAHAQQQ